MSLLTRTEILQQFAEKLASTVGRHLYLVMGTYAQLKAFERDLVFAKTPDRQQVPSPINVNRALLGRLPDQEVRKLVNWEAKRTTAIQERLRSEFDRLLKDTLAANNTAVLKSLELLFAFNLELAALRTSATDENHILLLLPGRRIGERIIIFQEAEERFHRILPENLFMEQHIWEISHGN